MPTPWENDPEVAATPPDAGPATPSPWEKDPEVAPDLHGMADAAADRHDIPRHIFRGLIGVESTDPKTHQWDPAADAHKNFPDSHAFGLTQMQPSTAAEMGVQDITDPAQQLEGGAKYLRAQYDRFGDWETALAAYHDGPGKVAAQGITEDTGEPYIDAVQRRIRADQQAARYDASLAAFKAANSGLSAADGAEALTRADQTGLAPSFVARDLPRVRAQDKAAQLKDTLASAPVLASYAAQSPAHATAVADDAENLSYLETFFGKQKFVPDGGTDYFTGEETGDTIQTMRPGILTALENGYASVQAQMIGLIQAHRNAVESSRKRDEEILTQQAQDPRLSTLAVGQLKQLKEKAPVVDEETKGRTNILLQRAMERASREIPGVKGHIAREMTAGSIEAVPQIAPLIIPGAGELALFGQTYGGLHNRFSLEQDKAGAPKYTPDQVNDLSLAGATATATIIGGIATSFSKIALKPFSAAIGRLLPKEATAAIGTAAADAVAAELPSAVVGFRQQLVARGLQMGEAALHGLGFMVGQAVIEDVTSQSGDVMTGGQYDPSKTVQRAKEAARASLNLLPLVALGPGMGLTSDIGRSWRAQSDAVRVQSVVDAAKRSTFIKAAPDHAQELVGQQEQAGDPANRTAYIPVEAFDAAIEAAQADAEQVTAGLADGGAAYREAKTTGGDVAIPMSEVLTKLAPAGIAEHLVPDLKLDADPLAMTPREAGVFAETLGQFAKASGGDAAGRLYTAAINRLAELSGKTPEEILGRAPLTIESPGRFQGIDMQRAAEVVKADIAANGKPSVSHLQRIFNIGYTRAQELANRLSGDTKLNQASTEDRARYQALQTEQQDILAGHPDGNGLTDEQVARMQEISREMGAMEREHSPSALLYQGPSGSDPWYSALERAAETAKQAKGTPDSWLAVLSKTPGVKAEEIAETGVKEWLAQQKGVVSREQVMEHLRAHRVELQETVLGGAPNALREIEKAYSAAQGKWTGADWDLPENAGVEYSRRVERDAKNAEENGEDAIRAARNGRLDDALNSAEEAARLEAKWGESPTWGPLVKAIEAAQGDATKDTLPAHVADLPPDLAAKVLAEGQPLFQGGPTVAPGQERGSITIGPKTDTGRRLTIRFGDGADESTIAHEAFHALSVVIGDLAAEKDATPDIQDLHERLAKEMGYENGAERNGKLDPAKEEAGASAFEQYLFEGKAPTPELASIFAQFKAWLGRIYGSIRGQLTGNMRGILDEIFGGGQLGGETQPSNPEQGERAPGDGQAQTLFQGQPDQLAEAARKAKEARDMDAAYAAWSAERIARRPLGEVKPYIYEQRARLEAAEMKRLADATPSPEQADALAKAQEQHIVNDHLARAAERALEQARKLGDEIEKRATDEQRQVVQRADREIDPTGQTSPYTDAHDAIMEALDLRAPDGPPKDVAGAVDRLVKDDRLNFDPDALVAALAKQGGPQALTLADLQVMRNALNNVRRASHAAVEVVADEKKATYADQERQLLDLAAQRGLEREAPAPSRATETTLDRGVKLAKTAYAEQLGIETVFAKLGKVGEFYRDLYLNASRRSEPELRKSILEPMKQAMDAMPEEMQRTRLDPIEAPPMGKNPDGSDILSPDKWVRQDAMLLWAWFGNASSAERAVKGLGLVPRVGRQPGMKAADVQKAQAAALQDSLVKMHKYFDVLTKAEKDFVQQSIWNINDQVLKPRLVEQTAKRSGVPMETIDAQPIHTKDGDYAGGFHHAKYNTEASSRAGARAAFDPQGVGDYYGDLKSGWATGPAAGFTKSRVEGAYDVPSVNWSDVTSHVENVVHYLAVSDYVDALGGLLRRSSSRDAIKAVIGADGLAQIDDHLRAEGAGGVDNTSLTALDHAGNALRSRAVQGIFLANIKVGLQQFSHPIAASVPLRLDPISMIYGLAKATQGAVTEPFHLLREFTADHLFSGWGKAQNPAAWEEARAISEQYGQNELNHRWQNYTENTRKLYGQMAPDQFNGKLGRAFAPVAKLYDAVVVSAMYHVIDGFQSQWLWRAADFKYRNLPIEQRALLADQIVQRALPPLDRAELSKFARGKGPVAAMILTKRFTGTLINLQELATWESRTNAFAANPGLDKVKKVLGAGAYAFLVYQAMTLSAHLVGKYLAGHGQREDESTPQWLARQWLIGQGAPVSFGEEVLTPIAEHVVNEKKLDTAAYKDSFARLNPLASYVAQEFGDASEALTRSDLPDDDRVFKGLRAGLRLAPGGAAPISLMNQGRSMYDVLSGKTNVRGPFDFLHKATYGDQKPGHREASVFSDLSKAFGE